MPPWLVGGQVHKDEGRLLISNVQGRPIRGRLPAPDVVLHLPVVERVDEPLDEMGFITGVLIRVGQMVQDPHASMQFLYRLVRQLDYTIKLSPQQLRITGWDESPLVLVKDVLKSLRPSDADVHDRLQRQSPHVGVRQVLGFLIRPSMVGGDDLELRAPGQEVLPREISKMDNLGVMGAGRQRLGSLTAAVIQ